MGMAPFVGFHRRISWEKRTTGNGVVQARQPASVNLLQRATTGCIWPQKHCWTAFVDEVRAVRLMDCDIRVIGMKRGKDAQSRSWAKSFFQGVAFYAAVVLKSRTGRVAEMWLRCGI
jgi:hypothetical protein